LRFFFYGTLMDADVRRLVLGRQAPEEVAPAILRGWRRVPLAGVTYPGIVRDPQAAVDGVLARGVDHDARQCLERYEGVEYELIAVEIVSGAGRARNALTFVAGAALKPATGSWEFAVWQRRHKRRFLAALAQNGSPS
jgi:hypothetical protein